MRRHPSHHLPLLALALTVVTALAVSGANPQDARSETRIGEAAVWRAAGLPGGAQETADAGDPTLVGTWAVACCREELKGTLSITRQQGITFSGTMADPLTGEVMNGQLRGNRIECDRRGGWGTQHGSAQLANDGGSLRMINGTWTGDFVDRFPGRNNWHAEKKK